MQYVSVPLSYDVVPVFSLLFDCQLAIPRLKEYATLSLLEGDGVLLHLCRKFMLLKMLINYLQPDMACQC